MELMPVFIVCFYAYSLTVGFFFGYGLGVNHGFNSKTFDDEEAEAEDE